MKRKIDIASIGGLIVAVALMFWGIATTSVTNPETGKKVIDWAFKNLWNFWDLQSVAIVFGGTFGCLLIMFPLSHLAKIPKQLRIIFMPRQYVPTKYIETLVECARKARINGLLALEEDASQMQDIFLKNSIQMLVDSVDPEKVKLQMESWLDNIDERHTQERSFYDKGAALGPAFGMIGTLIGLINMMQTLDKPETVGPGMAVALVTTFYGSVLANVLFAPISNKLRVRHDEEYLCMRIVCEGVQAIQAGENPNLIQDRLLHLLPGYKQKKYESTKGAVPDDGGKSAKAAGKRVRAGK